MKDSPKEYKIKGITLMFSGTFLACMAYFVAWIDPAPLEHEIRMSGVIIFLISTPLIFFGFLRALLEKGTTNYLLFCNLILILWLMLGYFYFQTAEQSLSTQ